MSIGKIKSKCRVTVVATAAREIGIAFANEPQLRMNADLTQIIQEIGSRESAISAVINQQNAYSVQDEKDGRRDAVTRDLNKAITGYCAIPVEPIRSAAMEIASVFNLFGVSMVDSPYAVQSGHTNALLMKLNEPMIKEKTRQLPGVEQLITTLSAAQAEFEVAYVAYESAVADQKAVESASTLKPILIDTINGKLVTLLRALTMLNEHQYGHFSSVVGQIIERANSSSKTGKADKELVLS